MVLVERMVLLLIEMAPNNCMTESNLLLVCSVMNKRHGLHLGSGLDHFHQTPWLAERVVYRARPIRIPPG